MHTSDLWDLARAVTTTNHARLLNPDNTATEPLPLRDAIRSGQAYMVTPRPELLVVDVDLPPDPTRTADLLTHVEHLTRSAQRAGVPAVTVASGRPGHAHLYLVTGANPTRARLAHWAASVGMDVRTHGIRPPGSPHRDGTTRAWTPDAAPAEVTRTLRATPDVAATTSLANAVCPVQLPQRLTLALRHGHAHAGYDSPSHARMALAVAVRARGGHLPLLRALLTDPTSPLGGTFRQRHTRWQEQELTRLWHKAGQWLTTDHPHTPTDDLAVLAGAIAEAPWSGAGGANDLAVLEELVRRARTVPTTTVGVSLGDLAVGAGVSVDTARAGLRRLTAGGWVQVASEHTARTTRMYALRIPAGVNPSRRRAQVPDRGTVYDLGSDVTRPGALGKTTLRVARALAGAPGVRTADLSRELGMNTPALRHHLRKLRDIGLATGNRHGWSPVAEVGQVLDEVAQDRGVAGRRAAQARQVAEQRAARAAARAGTGNQIGCG